MKITQPVYLDSRYNNIPIEATWNQGVSKALRDLAEDLSKAKNDVYEIEIEKNNNLEEFGASGSAGYSTPASQKTDYFYVEFSLSLQEDALKEVFSAIQQHAATLEGYTLSKCLFDTSEDLQDLTARAYFVKDNTQQ